MIPTPSRAGLINNYINPFASDRLTDIPAIKVDHNISSRAKLSTG